MPVLVLHLLSYHAEIPLFERYEIAALLKTIIGKKVGLPPGFNVHHCFSLYYLRLFPRQVSVFTE
jgi:hypothetical protein